MAKPKKESTAIATTEDAESQLMERTGGFGESSHPGYERAEVLSVDKFNVQRSAVGSVFRGIYLYTKDGAEFHDKDSGEVKQLTFHFFQLLQL